MAEHQVGPDSPPNELEAALARLAPPRKRAPRKAAAKKAAKKAPAKRSPRKRPPKADDPVGEAAKAAIAVIENPPEVVDLYENPRKAHEELLAGAGWETVTAKFGYHTVQEATLAVQAYLAYVHVMTGDDERQMAKRMELDRLDVMWREWYQLGTSLRDSDAAKVLLAISKARRELHELDKMSQRQGSQQTIVITTGGAMAAQLQQLALDQQAREVEARRVLQGGQPQDVVDAELVEPTPQHA